MSITNDITETEPEKIQINVSNIDGATFRQIQAKAKQYGVVADAAVVRFALEQYANGRSINDE